MNASYERAVRVGLARAALEPCVLCRNPDSPYLAVFTPTPELSRRLGVPEGKTRLVFYSLCEGCFARPDKADAVEAGMLAFWGGRS